jgi:hypothetical protein
MEERSPKDDATWYVRDSIEHLRKEQGARAAEHYKNQYQIIGLLRWIIIILVLILAALVARYWR